MDLAALNTDLIHVLDNDGNLLKGNGGWSYTLNNISPIGSSYINFTGQKSPLKDSMVFEGRTPCGVPGLIAADAVCYKLKWRKSYCTAILNAVYLLPTNYLVPNGDKGAAGKEAGKL